jgi:hypothetical protein
MKFFTSYIIIYIISLMPVILTVIAGKMDYFFWSKRIKVDPPQPVDKAQVQVNKTNSEKYYNPNLTFYKFGTVLGIIVSAIYLIGFLLKSIKDPIDWQTVVLKLGILAGAITILAIIAKMIKEE